MLLEQRIIFNSLAFNFNFLGIKRVLGANSRYRTYWDEQPVQYKTKVINVFRAKSSNAVYTLLVSQFSVVVIFFNMNFFFENVWCNL